MNNKLFKLVKKIYDFFAKMSEDKIGIYTAQASFFIILSIFPFVLLLLNVIGLTSIDKTFILNTINSYAPESIRPLLTQMINELYTHVSGTIISIAAVGAIWSASKGFLSVMFGIYNIYKVHQNRNYFVARFISMIYTVIFLIAMIITMILLVFGNRIFKFAISLIPALKDISILTLIVRYLIVFLVLTMFFVIIFRIANFKNTTFMKVLPGATFSSLGWIIFSYAFSIYVDNFSNMTYMYGSLTAVIILMLWTYFCIYIFFIGAEINIFYYPEITQNSEISNNPL
ncbi:MAG: YihY/virulence factor BrkB family protein [Eubacterium sp.]